MLGAEPNWPSLNEFRLFRTAWNRFPLGDHDTAEPFKRNMLSDVKNALDEFDRLERVAAHVGEEIDTRVKKLSPAGDPSSASSFGVSPITVVDRFRNAARLIDAEGKVPPHPASSNDPVDRLLWASLDQYGEIVVEIRKVLAPIAGFNRDFTRHVDDWEQSFRDRLEPLVNRLVGLARRAESSDPPARNELDDTQEIIDKHLNPYAEFFDYYPTLSFRALVVQALKDDIKGIGKYVSDEQSLTAEKESLVAQGKAIAAQFDILEKAGAALSASDAKLAIERVAASAFPSARFGARTYPIPPTEIDDVFLAENIKTLVLETREKTQTATPRSDDVRNFLRHEIEGAYDLLERYQSFVPLIHQMIRDRSFDRLEKEAFPQLLRELPGDLRGQSDAVVAVLCWAVAVEGALLDRQLKDDMKVVMKRHPASCPDPESLSFFEYVPSPDAESAFEWYVKNRWPMIVFALDPTVDQQNIADAYSLRRDLQLAVAFAFATGRINMSQLTRFNRKIEQDAETIALNKTVSSFSYGNETFGWRFYPRYQNPPMERNNLQVATNLLWRGGPGRNYQLSNSKIEPGIRELTAVIIMPSFLQNVRFDVTGNWFPLHDPDQMKTHTARMLEQGREVMELRKALATAEQCNCYRSEDLERLSTRIDQLESLLPMQTRRTQVPYENTLGGFQLFTQGSLALVPELTGYQGVEFVEQGKTADILVFGRHFSLHESKVVAGGAVLVPSDASLGTTGVELVSREVMHLKLPDSVRPTNITADPLKRTGQGSKPYVEVYVATPTGISNRLLIPFKSKDDPAKTDPTTAEPAKPADPGYIVLDAEFKIQGTITVDAAATAAQNQATAAAAGSVGAGASTTVVKTAADASTAAKDAPGDAGKPKADGAKSKVFKTSALAYAKTDKIRIMPTKAPANTTDTIDAEFRFRVDNNVYINVSAKKLPFKTDSYEISNDEMQKMAEDFLSKLNTYGKLPTGGASLPPTLAQTTLITLSTKDGATATTYNPLRISVSLFPVLDSTPSTAKPAAASAASPIAAPTVTSAPAATTPTPTTPTTPGAAAPKSTSSNSFELPPLPDTVVRDASLARTGVLAPKRFEPLPPLPPQWNPARLPSARHP
jgi:hypothetical protein